MKTLGVCGLFSVLILSACSTSTLKYEKVEELKVNQEFEEAVKIEKPVESEVLNPPATSSASSSNAAKTKSSIKKTQAAPTVKPTPRPKAVTAPPVKKSSKLNTKKAAETASNEVTEEVAQEDDPERELEDKEGFNGRRPSQDPFRVGEEVVHDVRYFKVSAGELRMKVEPFATVNKRKSYAFAIEIRTSSLFNAFYSVNDRVETFVDFEDFVPRVFQLHVKESGQLREAKMLFDTEKNVATFWEKKVTKEDGEEEKKQQWDILPFSQNVYSAVFYLRNFKWDIGKEYSFRVANDNENLIFSGRALRREVLDTKLGPMKAIVIQPKAVLKGKFKSIGDNFIWLSDDDRRYILRIESKIKIGTLVSEVIEIKPGR